MHSGTQWREKFYLLTMFRVGRKVSNVFLAALTATRLNGGLNGTAQSPPSDVYREKAFRYLLESEAKRSERSGRLCQILLVYRTNAQGAIVPMEPDIAKAVIVALSGSLRDTDYIGWYREEQIVGVILTVLCRDSVADGCNRLRTRLAEILPATLAFEETCPVQIRVYRHDEVMEVELTRPA